MRQGLNDSTPALPEILLKLKKKVNFMIRKRLIVAIISAGILSSATGCGELFSPTSNPPISQEETVSTTQDITSPSPNDTTPPVDNNDTTAKKKTRGNTAGNLANFGLVVEDGDWLYYLQFFPDTDDTRTLYRTRLDNLGNSREQIHISTLYLMKTNLNIVDSYVYFIDETDDVGSAGCISRVKTDGTGYEVLYDAPCLYLSAVDNWLYFEVEGDDQHLYKMRLDGSARQAISITSYDNDGFEDYIDSYYGSMLSVEDDWMYYCVSVYTDKSSEDGIARTLVDGSESELLLLGNDESITNLIVSEECLYYIKRNYSIDEVGIYRARLDGTGETKLNNGEISVRFFNTDGTNVFYISNENNLYQLLPDGTSREIVGDETVEIVYLSSDHLYYYSADLDTFDIHIYRIRFDGTELEIID